METTSLHETQPLQRRSYVLRLWAVQVQGQAIWHAALVSIPEGEAQGFAGLENLFEYLKTQTMPVEAESE